jgi:SM-20-related protein
LSLVFEEIITSFLASGVGQSSEFLSRELALSLKENLLHLNDKNAMFHAGIGQNEDFHKDEAYRKDKILWLEKSSVHPAEVSFLSLVDSFVEFLNQTCYAGIQDVEFHYALYEKGSYYKKHLDQFSKSDSRVYSVIIYLNEDWKQGDGGELVLYKESGEVKIDPEIGTMVFFDSSKLAHEVLVTEVPRMSLTGWLKR